MADNIDLETYLNLMRGLFTCYWCGGLADAENIGPHVDRCLAEIRWLNKHIAMTGDKAEI